MVAWPRMGPTSRPLILCVAIGAALLATGGEGSALADRRTADEHLRRGQAEFSRGDFDAAIVEFQAGLRDEPDARFAYHIARCHELGRRPAEALAYYRKYLAMAPTAKNRPEVEERIADLERQPAPAPLSAPSTEASPAAAPPAATAETPSARRRWPIWLGIALGIVVVGVAAGVTAAMLTPKDAEAPHTLGGNFNPVF